MKYLYFFIFIISSFTSLSAQHQRFIHRTFQLDTATVLELELFGEYAVETWVGSDVMIETKVSLSNTPEGIFNHYIKQGRYEIEEKREGETLRLVSKDLERPKINTPSAESEELVTVKVFIPDIMKLAGDHRWERPKESKED